MFKKIVIQLTAPICSCDEQKLSWGISSEIDKKGTVSYGLLVSCELCATKLSVPYGKFVAAITLDTPYPSKKAEVPKPKPKLDVMDGGKVIPLQATEKKEKEDSP